MLVELIYLSGYIRQDHGQSCCVTVLEINNNTNNIVFINPLKPVVTLSFWGTFSHVHGTQPPHTCRNDLKEKRKLFSVYRGTNTPNRENAVVALSELLFF